jgi:phosphohistidine phosphatase
MKTLFILRHAEALSDTGGGDINRSLSERGFYQARMLGQAMHDRAYLPAFTFCSSALRTRQTFEGLNETLRIANNAFDKIIYHGVMDDLLRAAQNFDDGFSSALIVGHNPVIHELALRLLMDAPARLLHGYPPATLTAISCPVNIWADLRLDRNALIEVLKADDYCKPAST